MGILDFISGQEGYSPRATWDYKQWTNGFGTRARHAGEVIDRDEATRRLKGEVDQARGYVTSSFGNLEAPQLDALTSFTYNLGPGWTKNGSRLSKAVAAGDWKSASSIMQEYNKAGGSVLPGLVSRRRAEGAMMLGGPAAPPGPSSETPTEPELPPMLIPGSTEFWNQNRAKKGEPELPPMMRLGGPEPEAPSPQAGQPPQSLWESIMNPMTLAGLSILGSPTRDVGQGMQAGLLAQQRLDKRQDQQQKLLDPMHDLERRHKEALIEKLQREQAQAAENAERQKALYDTFMSPQGTSSAPVPMSSEPGSPGAARFAAPALAASAPATPQTPQEIFNALPPNKKAQAQMALASGDMDEFRKILGEGPPQLADNLTPGEKRVDQAFAKSYEDFVLSGSAADFDKNLKQMRGVHGELTDPKGANLTGPVLGRMPDFVTAYTNPEAVDARQRIEEVVQRNLRIILGAQFTQKEGENLIARAYNPALDEATNAKRLERLITSMEKMKEAKLKAMDYFERNGTMKGFRGTTQFGVDSILADLDTPEQRDTSGGSKRPDPLGLFGGS